MPYIVNTQMKFWTKKPIDNLGCFPSNMFPLEKVKHFIFEILWKSVLTDHNKHVRILTDHFAIWQVKHHNLFLLSFKYKLIDTSCIISQWKVYLYQGSLAKNFYHWDSSPDKSREFRQILVRDVYFWIISIKVLRIHKVFE